MSVDLPGALSSENPQISSGSDGGGFFSKKLVIALVALIIVIGVVMFFVWKFVISKNIDTNTVEVDNVEKEENNNEQYFPKLENFDDEEDYSEVEISTTTDIGIEKISFLDYYQSSNENIQTGFVNYNLPINVKVDVLNYYDVSRKLNLDPVVNDLNTNGFAAINNPWSSLNKDFYSIYSTLKEYQIPILISSDFLIYYQQNAIKTVFKDVEKNIFFDDLFEVSVSMYEAAKRRYEARLSEMGSVNDTILEASRLETVYFAVALELLKPTDNQIVKSNIKNSGEKFSIAESELFSVTIPENIRVEVEAEVELIRSGKRIEKSPTLLYSVDYSSFDVPDDYKNNDKLNNFYLTNKWLNSVFPLNYKSEQCPECQLDKEDWQINIIAASMIADDFYSLPSLKNRWARIYKLISFFKGLKDDLSYVDYHNALLKVFGEDYKINDLFVRTSDEFDKNLDDYAKEISSYKFLESQGALSRSDADSKKEIGFRLLADSFSPDNYIFKKLSYPETGAFQSDSLASDNITSCRISGNTERCHGFSFDILNLFYPIEENSYFIENTNYRSYSLRSDSLKEGVNLSIEKKSSNYWSGLSYIKDYLNENKNYYTNYAKTAEWKNRKLNTASAAWVNLQTPMDRFSLLTEENQTSSGSGLGNFSRFSENYYVENDYSLISELIAQTDMITKMFKALNLDNEVRSAVLTLEETSYDLSAMKNIIVKQIEGQELLSTDYETISSFSNKSEENLSVNERKIIDFNLFKRNNLEVNIDEFKLLILVNENEDGKYFSVGPIWNYQEE